MNAKSALPEGPAAVEHAGVIERVGAAKSDAFKYRLQPEYGQRGKGRRHDWLLQDGERRAEGSRQDSGG